MLEDLNQMTIGFQKQRDRFDWSGDIEPPPTFIWLAGPGIFQVVWAGKYTFPDWVSASSRWFKNVPSSLCLKANSPALEAGEWGMIMYGREGEYP